jgi:hypothetical protein
MLKKLSLLASLVLGLSFSAGVHAGDGELSMQDSDASLGVNVTITSEVFIQPLQPVTIPASESGAEFSATVEPICIYSNLPGNLYHISFAGSTQVSPGPSDHPFQLNRSGGQASEGNFRYAGAFTSYAGTATPILNGQPLAGTFVGSATADKTCNGDHRTAKLVLSFTQNPAAGLGLSSGTYADTLKIVVSAT